MTNEERFLGRTRKQIIGRKNRKIASQVRAVEEHFDRDYRAAIAGSLKGESLPLAALLDKIGKKLPRLAETSISAYFDQGTYVDQLRLARILDEMELENEVVSETLNHEGMEIQVYQLPKNFDLDRLKKDERDDEPVQE